MKKEIWKSVKNFAGLYEVSNLGNVRGVDRTVKGRARSFQNGQPLKFREVTGGYLCAFLSKNGKRYGIAVHRLVWDAFGNSARNGRELQVDHIDGNKYNNCIDNLQLLSARNNVTKGYKAKRQLPTGVYKNKNGNYYSRILVNGTSLYLGTHKTIEDASLAYQGALSCV